MAGQTGHCAGAALKLLALLIISNCVKVVAWTDKRAAEGETVKIRAVLEDDRGLEGYFTSWASQHGLKFRAQERAARLAQFRRGLEAIVRINSDDNSTFWAAPNAFTAMSFEEFSAATLHTSVPKGEASGPSGTSVGGRKLLSEDSPPSYFNWVEQGMVTPIRSQGKCGACWAFAAVAALESKYLITRSQQLDLSEQHMIDCVTAAAGFSSNGCEGGWPTDALQYAVRYNTSFEESYPYIGVTGTCDSALLSRTTRHDVARMKKSKGFITVPPRDPVALMQAVTNQPVITATGVGEDFQYYAGGIYPASSCQGIDINHSMLVVGYRTGSGAGAGWWLIRNSWGTDWGEDGYARLEMLGAGSEGACKMYEYNYEPRSVLRVPKKSA